MHPFHRAIHHVQSHVPMSKLHRDVKNNVDFREREGYSDKSIIRDKSRKTSPNRRKELLDARYAECVQTSACVTPSEWQTNKRSNALKAKETFLGSRSCTEWDNSERLRSNINNIIKESLKENDN